MEASTQAERNPMSYLYECSVCHRQTVSEAAATIDNDRCCMVCANDHNHSGKFERYACSDPQYFDAEAMGKALLYYAFLGSGDEDDAMSNEGWGYCARFENVLVFEDTQGFVTYDEFKDTEAAEKKFNEYYIDGWGAQEDDIYITHEMYRGWQAWESGKQIHVWARRNEEYPDRRRVLAAISLHMRKTGYFPNVWEETHHGIKHIGTEVW